MIAWRIVPADVIEGLGARNLQATIGLVAGPSIVGVQEFMMEFHG